MNHAQQTKLQAAVTLLSGAKVALETLAEEEHDGEKSAAFYNALVPVNDARLRLMGIHESGNPDPERQYRFIADPGHGWLEVPVEELRALGIVQGISNCSYLSVDGKLAYLEEDCDLPAFLRAKIGSHYLSADSASCTDFMRDRTNYTHQENTFIRKLRHFEMVT